MFAEPEFEHKPPAAAEERQLLQVLLADPDLVPLAAATIRPEQIQHPGLRRLLHGLYDLVAAGESPTLYRLGHSLGHPALELAAFKFQRFDRTIVDRQSCLIMLLAEFREKLFGV